MRSDTPWRRRGHLLVSPALAFDLWTANADQLRAAGVGRVEIAGACTKCGDEEVYSFRGGDVGLLGPAIPPLGSDPPADPPR